MLCLIYHLSDFSRMFWEKNSAECLSKEVSQYMRNLVKHLVVHTCRFTDYSAKELPHWGKTHASVITLLIEDNRFT